jgi:predicted small lipoprotein YifL
MGVADTTPDRVQLDRMRRALPALLLLSILAFLATGCGSGGALSLDPVASAATKTQQAGTYAFTFAADITAAGQKLSFTGSGVSDTANAAAQMTFDFSGLPAAMTKNGSTAEAIMVDKKMYMKMSFLAGQLPSGKQWLELDLGKALQATGVDPSSSLGQTDPQQWLQQLLASGDTQTLGTDTVQGEQMTHYRTQIDPANTDQIPADQRAAVKKALQQLGLSKIPVDAWVDGQGLLRRMSLSFALSTMSMTMSMDLSQFGTPVSITAPPADQVFDATPLMQKYSRTHG